MKKILCVLAVACWIVVGSFAVQAGDQKKPGSSLRVLAVLSEDEISKLRAAVPEVELIAVNRAEKPATWVTGGKKQEVPPYEDPLELAPTADAVIGTCTPELVRAGKNLRWIQVNSAGVDHLMFPELVESDIVLTNMKIVNGPDIADHAMALLLCLTRNIHIALRTRDWSLHYQYNPIVLRGKTALIIGLGGIGTQVAERAAAFGMQVLAVDPKDIPYLNSVSRIGKPEQLKEFLPRADVIFVCCPHTKQTSGLIGPAEFALMKQGAYFINVSRGKIVQTDALVETLRQGRLAGVGLDVVDTEPMPQDHPLWNFDNVVITPHIAYKSDSIRSRKFEIIKDNLKRFSKGLPLRNVVNKTKGY